jgi:hypothetical protein
MAGLFSPSNTTAQDEAVAMAVDGPIRLYLENLTSEQVVEVLHQVGYCPDCGTDLKTIRGKLRRCRCLDDD